jgi:hypothetical protein
MPYGTRMVMEPVRSLAFGAIGAGYAAVGTALSNPVRMVFIQNLTNASLMFSIDGINDHFPLAANGFLLLDISSDKTFEGSFFMSKGTVLSVKQIGVPATGSVYFSVFYGLGD